MAGAYDRRARSRWIVQGAVAAPVRARPAPRVLVETEDQVASPWHVVLFNDDVHSFEEVIGQLVKATRCSTDRATELAWQAHTEGKAVVFDGEFAECYRVQAVLQEIALITELRG